MSFAIAGTVLTIGATAYGANRAGAAADAQAGAANQANRLTADQFQQTRADQAPWTAAGGGAMNRLSELFGLPSSTASQFAASQPVTVGDSQLPGGTQLIPAGNGWYDVKLADGTNVGVLQPGGANGRFVSNGAQIPASTSSATPAQTTAAAPNLNAFFTSPGYDFRRTEGMRGIENSAAARGGLQSGNALRALTDFNSNLASGEFGNYVNQLLGVAGMGQASSNTVANAGQNTAAQQSRNSLYAGESRASGIENQANVIGGGVNSLSALYGYLRKPTGLSNSTFNSFVQPYQITGAAAQRMY